jgi:uncharacterized RDD family membrane protein YckC
VRCPRCHLETGDPAPAFCTGCGAPLRLREEPAARRLDVPLSIDRRGERDEPVPPPPLPVVGAPAELPGRSHWDLGGALAIAQRDAEPLPVNPTARVPSAAPSGPDELPEPEPGVVEIRLRRPETWRRAAAAALDVGPFVAGGGALVSSLLSDAGLAAPVTGLGTLLDLVARERVIVLSVAAALTLAVAVYSTLAHGLAGATLGKRLLGLTVVGPDGRRPSLGRSAARAGLALLSAALLGLGLLLALFTRSGRGLHDYAARTWVVDGRSRPLHS